MKRLLKDTKGAVTVFVTLLLIPAILISGTAVDLARIHTARSIIQDANQLAANSVLSQYNALLHDLYSLFGVAKNDPILAELLDEYIEITVFGESGRDTSMGTLQLFYGSDLSLEELYFKEDKNLSNAEVLKRQILEYMKFRGPVIIVQELLNLIGSSTFKEDTEVIEDKLEIDEGIAELYDKYKELYDAIVFADQCKQITGVGGILGTVTRLLENIRANFENLRNCAQEWDEIRNRKFDGDDIEDEEEREAERREFEEDKAADLKRCEEKYNSIRTHIRTQTVGAGSTKGLNRVIEESIVRALEWKVNFDKVVTIAREIDAMSEELRQKVEELKARLETDECNTELKEALTKRDPEIGKSVIELYEDILKWEDIESMAKVFKDGGHHYIDVPFRTMVEGVIYRNVNAPSGSRLTREELANVPSDGRLSLSWPNSFLRTLGGYTKDQTTYKMPDGFLRFKEHPGDNATFFAELERMMKLGEVEITSLYEDQEEAEGDDAEEKQRNLIDDLMNLVDSAYAGLFNDPLGAKFIHGGINDEEEDEEEGAGSISESVSTASNHKVSDVISNPEGIVEKAGDYLLLLTYCTSMFSNYTTARPEITGKKMDEIDDVGFPKSVSGIPIYPKVNYFFQSEWEYLFHGSEDAGKNLSAVSRLIYLVRVVCNYITVFSVKEVTTIVNSIRTAFSWSPPLGVILGELARAAFVAAESAVDLATLRAGYKVPLIKSGKNGEWICSPTGLVNALKDTFADTVKGDEKKEDDEKGLSYSHYLLFFFLAKTLEGSGATDELIKRTSDLIEWNVINYKEGILCDEGKMEEALSAEGRFKMGDLYTDLSLTTAVDMRMLFLSMVIAQNYSESRGITMPHTMRFRMTDYRGY